MSLMYIDRQLHMIQSSAQYNLLDMAKEVGEPFYLYDLEGIRRRANYFKNSFKRNIRVHYALKANYHPEILKTIKEVGFGVDVVSGGELQIALKLGFEPEQILFSGVGKTVKEVELAVKSRISQINVESPQELDRIGKISSHLGLGVRVAWRMNPDVKAETHPYITTGFRNNKFGMDESFLPQLLQTLEMYPSLHLVGLTMHIGSQIRQISPFLDALEKIKVIYSNLKLKGYHLKTLNLGGGLGINYNESDLSGDEEYIHQYAVAINQSLSGFDGEILMEPGRVLVGSFGWLLGEVQYVKSTPWKNFAILNTGMHHLLRPSLYQAHHRIIPVVQKERDLQAYDIVGPICESSDVLGYDRYLPEVEQGDWLVIEDVGAYGRVMASDYNSQGFPKEIAL